MNQHTSCRNGFIHAVSPTIPLSTLPPSLGLPCLTSRSLAFIEQQCAIAQPLLLPLESRSPFAMSPNATKTAEVRHQPSTWRTPCMKPRLALTQRDFRCQPVANDVRFVRPLAHDRLHGSLALIPLASARV